jgi:hypothetical protein
MTRPPLPISGTASLMAIYAPRRLTAMTRSNCSSVDSCSGTRANMPALLTRMSTRIGADRFALDAVLADRRDDILGLARRTEIGDDDLGAIRGQFLGDRRADAAACARYERRFSFQSLQGVTPFYAAVRAISGLACPRESEGFAKVGASGFPSPMGRGWHEAPGEGRCSIDRL